MSIPPPTDKQARLLWASLTALSIGILLALLALLLWGLSWLLSVLSPVIWPLAIAAILAYLLDPVVDYLEKKRVPRGRAIVFVFLVGILAVGGVLASVLPRMVREAGDLVSEVPHYSAQIQTTVTEWISRTPWLMKKPKKHSARDLALTTNGLPARTPAEEPTTNAPALAPPKGLEKGWDKRITESAIGWATGALPVFGSWFLAQVSRVASWAGFIVGFAMVPVFTYYFLQEKTGIRAEWTNYLPVQESRFKQELVFVLNAINGYLIVFFRGQVIVAMCIGALLTFGFSVVGLNYAVLLGLLAGALSIVPYLGAILTIVPSVILAAVQFKDWLHPLLVVAVFVFVQMLEGFVISPKIMGDRVGLHPLTIIIAVLVGTTLMGGILGGVLAIPLTAALRVIMFRYVWHKREPATGTSAAADG